MASQFIHISGFGDNEVNGTYEYLGIRNGHPAWSKNGDHLIQYFSSYMPWSNYEGYYIIKTIVNRDHVSIDVPKYKVDGTNPYATGWKSLRPITAWNSASQDDAGNGGIDVNISSSSSSLSSSSSINSSLSSLSSTSSSESLGNISSSSSSRSSNRDI